MAERGRHRRHGPDRLARVSRTVATGGVGAALPLLTAGGATAAPESWSSPDPCTQAPCPPRAQEKPEPDAGPDTRDRQRPAASSADEDRASVTSVRRPPSYRVVHGDTLSAIADSQGVTGGWPRLYADNRTTVGDDPDLILPGQRLTLPAEKGRRHLSAPGKATPRPRPTEKKPDAAASSPQKAAPAKGKPTASAHREAAGKQRAQAERTEDDRDRGKAGRAKEHATDRKGRGTGPARATTAARVLAPVAGFAPSTPYRSAGGSWSSGHHTGVDFPVPTGTAVKAVSGGRVVTAGWGGAYGYQVVIRHADGRYTQYGHLSALSVRSGQTVEVGQRIGRSGSTGNSTGPHLHFEVRTGPEYGSDVDPLAYLRGLGVDI